MERIEELFHAALHREPGERAAFLSAECAGDEVARREVESLLDFHDNDERSLDASDLAADLLEHDRAERAVGRTIGAYKILKPLAAGGMGAIFLAQDTKLAARSRSSCCSRNSHATEIACIGSNRRRAPRRH
jgi:hypothetical protein